MPERHTVEFDQFGVNILSDAELATISLQFDETGGAEPIGRMMKGIERRFGSGIWARLDRWKSGQGNPLVLSSPGGPHPENPDVIRLEMTVQQGERMDAALAVLMDFLRCQQGYRRTLVALATKDARNWGDPYDGENVASSPWELPYARPKTWPVGRSPS